MQKTNRLTAVSSLIILSFFFSMVVQGCQSSSLQTVKDKPSAADISQPKSPPMTPFVEENLSMARSLRDHRPSEYVLGPEDSVEITVLGHEDLKLSVAISPTGKIPYYTNNIQAAGLTQFQLKELMQKEVSELVKDPKVVVRITEYRSHKVFMVGQLKNPGVYPMRSDVTLLEAISMAGGVTPEAYLSGAFVVRDGKILLVNFLDLITKGNTEENIPLFSNDIVYIPDRRDQKVYVLGEVCKPSAVSLGEKPTLLTAITEAGGFTRDANEKAVLLLRGNLSKPEITEIDAKAILDEQNPTRDISLQQGDIVYVAASGFAGIERIAVRISHILEPLLQVARGMVLYPTAVDVMRGGIERTRISISP